MTVSSTNTKHVYAGNGLTTSWPFTFPILEAANVEVYVTDADLVVTKLATGYSVDTVNSLVVYPTLIPGLPTLPSTHKITLIRNIEMLQDLDLVNQGPFAAENIEASLDKAIMLLQQHEEVIKRTFKLGVDQSPTQQETEEFLSSVNNAKDEALAAAGNCADFVVAAQAAQALAEAAVVDAQAAVLEAQGIAEIAALAVVDSAVVAAMAAHDVAAAHGVTEIVGRIEPQTLESKTLLEPAIEGWAYHKGASITEFARWGWLDGDYVLQIYNGADYETKAVYPI